MPFSSPVHVDIGDDHDRLTVLLEITYTDPRGRIWTVPEMFVTDGASIPRVLWPLIGSPFTGPYRVPAVLHDAAYCCVGLTKEDADLMFYEAMLEKGLGRFRAWLMYSAVKLFGRVSWERAQRRMEPMAG
jgi:hypothetical protein